VAHVRDPLRIAIGKTDCRSIYGNRLECAVSLCSPASAAMGHVVDAGTNAISTPSANCLCTVRTLMDWISS